MAPQSPTAGYTQDVASFASTTFTSVVAKYIYPTFIQENSQITEANVVDTEALAKTISTAANSISTVTPHEQLWMRHDLEFAGGTNYIPRWEGSIIVLKTA
jgi:hypothetical protein